MPQIQTHHPLTQLNTFGLQAHAEHFVAITTIDQLQACIADAQLRALPWYILGGGSNLVLPELVHGLVLKMDLRGKTLQAEDDAAWYVAAQAGENWHEFVQWTLAQGWGGLENLSLIPGTVGASPVQNIGAYGVEIKDYFHQLTAIHLHSGEIRQFDHADCHFAYRDSIFKQAGGKDWCILEVAFRLPKAHQTKTSYGDIENELATLGLAATLQNVAQAVINVRQRKLPDPAQIGNAGSYFKNPIITLEQAQALKVQYPDLVMYTIDAQRSKLAAGWLIEQAGWKGRQLGPVGMFFKQALVMVNHGGARQRDVKLLEQKVQQAVLEQFGVAIESEPIYWN
ncbi:UDP-N-acetylmuramate dehydrogenase [Chitinibacter sp. FCG-7]|uniref:UDP-N-acetylenolpyruvoylglucosamine reductase n=1 Tax=Chitinibacter mangrovi TaxID=3153927 RepID=A0AAU7FBB2_9NEIS